MLLDIHTHNLTQARNGKAIYNLDLTGDTMPDLADDVYYSLSIHPWLCDEPRTDTVLARLRQFADHPRVIALGEIGLDKLRGAPLDSQIKLMHQVLTLNEIFRLPVIIHCVKAIDEIMTLRKQQRADYTWIIHGFRGKLTQMYDLTMRHGFYLSFGEHYCPDSLHNIPADHLCMETDESHISIEQLIQSAATIRETTPDCLSEQLQANYKQIFRY